MLSEILCRRFAVVFGEKRDQCISVFLSMRLLTQDKKKKVFIFHGTLTVTHSHLVNKLQRLNCILEKGTSESYNKTGLDGKTGVNLTSVQGLV